MFDTYQIRAVTEHVTKNVNVVEKRAPTDESVRLLREMQEKISSDVLNRVNLPGNVLRSQVFQTFSYNLYDNVLLVMYELNGKKRKVEVPLLDCRNLDELYMNTFKKLAEDIAILMLDNLTNEDKNVFQSTFWKK